MATPSPTLLVKRAPSLATVSTRASRTTPRAPTSVEDRRHLPVGEAVVDGYGDHAGLGAGRVHLPVAMAVEGEDRHSVADVEPAGQDRRQRVGAPVDVMPGERLVTAPERLGGRPSGGLPAEQVSDVHPVRSTERERTQAHPWHYAEIGGRGEKVARSGRRNYVDMSLAGKVAIVTGAAGGIGEVYSRRWPRRVPSGRCRPRRRRCAAYGEGRRPRPRRRRAALSTSPSRSRCGPWSTPSSAVLQASTSWSTTPPSWRAYRGAAVEYPIDWWERVLRVNLTGVLMCVQAVTPRLIERGGGKIVNISWRAFAVPGNAYTISKLGVAGLDESGGATHRSLWSRCSIWPTFSGGDRVEPPERRGGARADIGGTRRRPTWPSRWRSSLTRIADYDSNESGNRQSGNGQRSANVASAPRFSFNLYGSPTVDLVPLAVKGEQCGFEAIWLGDHVLAPQRLESEYPYATTPGANPLDGVVLNDVWVAVGAMLAATTTLNVGTGIYILPGAIRSSPRLAAATTAEPLGWSAAAAVSAPAGSSARRCTPCSATTRRSRTAHGRDHRRAARALRRVASGRMPVPPTGSRTSAQKLHATGADPRRRLDGSGDPPGRGSGRRLVQHRQPVAGGDGGRSSAHRTGVEDLGRAEEPFEYYVRIRPPITAEVATRFVDAGFTHLTIGTNTLWREAGATTLQQRLDILEQLGDEVVGPIAALSGR